MTRVIGRRLRRAVFGSALATAVAVSGLGLVGGGNFNDFSGFVDFSAIVLTNDVAAAEPTSKAGEPWNPARSDSWVAVDGLGRELPTFEEVGPTRPGKYVAAFYFLWNGRHGEAGPYDISKILAEHPEARNDPEAPYWGALGAPHHWGESIFGYYVGEDEGVLRKHAQMLGDAGVDVICFDVTNQLTYPESYRALFKVFSEMQKAGNKVPKVAFLCPFWAPNKVVRELWRDVYSQGFYSDVWFEWKGKPLILADPDLLIPNGALTSEGCVPSKLDNEKSVLTQRFSTDKPIYAFNFDSPTWNERGCAATFVVRDENGKIVERFKDVAISDNLPVSLRLKKPLPAGTYSAELSQPKGRVGWWSTPLELNENNDNYEEAANKARPQDGVRWLGATIDGKPENVVRMLSVNALDEELAQILDFFTFRPSQPDYFTGPTKPNQWSWLEAYPQHPYYNDKGELEEMGVGVAQNAVDGKLGVLSNPRAYGRSAVDRNEPAPENCDFTGRNFQQQWELALKTDPEIVFVTGWNEWIAGRFDITAPFNGATPVSFVDQFNEEFSRDVEPMKGGHEDAYYYQTIANIRRFKGVSKPEKAKTAPISLDGTFDDWANVAPVYSDTVDDQTRRDCRGWGEGTRYVNNTGRNDFTECRVSVDSANVYFYAKTNAPIVGDPTSENWLSLLIDVDENAETGDKGNDFVVASAADGKGLALKNTTDASAEPTPIEYRIAGAEIELAVPRAALGFDAKSAKSTKTPPFRFKWTDGIDVFGDWAGFTTDGDAAPNDRYYYRYR